MYVLCVWMFGLKFGPTKFWQMLYPCFSDKKRTSNANIFGFDFMESMQGKYVKKMIIEYIQ